MHFGNFKHFPWAFMSHEIVQSKTTPNEYEIKQELLQYLSRVTSGKQQQLSICHSVCKTNSILKKEEKEEDEVYMVTNSWSVMFLKSIDLLELANSSQGGHLYSFSQTV